MDIDGVIQKWENNISTKKTEHLTTGLDNADKLEIDNETIKKVLIHIFWINFTIGWEILVWK